MERKTAATFIAALALCAAPAFAAPHPHGGQQQSHNGHAAPAKLSLDEGRKWATDEPLRRHMGEVRELLAARADAILQRRLAPEQARELGTLIEAKVAAIVAECNLPPAADANLHVIVADLVEAADILQGRSREAPGNGAAKAVRASQMYATYFDHPGWRQVYSGR